MRGSRSRGPRLNGPRVILKPFFAREIKPPYLGPWPFGLVLMVLGHDFTYSGGPGNIKTTLGFFYITGGRGRGWGEAFNNRGKR